MEKISHERGEFDVTPAFVEALGQHAGFLIWTHGALMAEQQRLLQKSNRKRLTDDEQLRLADVTHVINVHRALDRFDDVDHTHFGFAGADQLHGNLVTWPCGCEIHHAIDHHKRSDGAEHLPHRSERHCRKHLHLHNRGVHAHHAAMIAEHAGKSAGDGD